MKRNKIYYEQTREAILEKHRTKYEEQKDTEEWKECRRVVNKGYAEKRKERLRQEKELVVKLQTQLSSLQ